MDPITTATIASTVFSILLPYVQKAGESMAQEIGKSIPGSIAAIYRTVIDRLGTKPSGVEAIRDLEKLPDNADVQGAFRNQLRKMLDDDETFADELRGLLHTHQQSGGTSIVQSGSGSVITGGGAGAGEKGIAVKGDVHGDVNMTQPKRD